VRVCVICLCYAVVAEIEEDLNHIDEWVQPEKVYTPGIKVAHVPNWLVDTYFAVAAQPAQSFVYHDPKGVVLIMRYIHCFYLCALLDCLCSSCFNFLILSFLTVHGTIQSIWQSFHWLVRSLPVSLFQLPLPSPPPATSPFIGNAVLLKLSRHSENVARVLGDLLVKYSLVFF
jgi:hypothetical protein